MFEDVARVWLEGYGEYGKYDEKLRMAQNW